MPETQTTTQNSTQTTASGEPSAPRPENGQGAPAAAAPATAPAPAAATPATTTPEAQTGPAAATGNAAGAAPAGSSPADPVLVPAAELAELRRRAAERDDLHAQLQRARADFLNYQQRAVRDRESALKYRSEPLLRDLLPALDNFDRALRTPGVIPDGPGLQGLLLMEREIFRLLENHGLKPIDSIGKPFDPSAHEVITVDEKEDGPEDNTIVAEFRKAYRLHDRVLRPAQVSIARRKPKAAPAAPPAPDTAAQAGVEPPPPSA
ncbi:MAG: nucleotide exchange factor GrpE [Planctomycetes bacterium]|nr:nucleotide exchange factor GrpE [Planctomycetota bacterium]